MAVSEPVAIALPNITAAPLPSKPNHPPLPIQLTITISASNHKTEPSFPTSLSLPHRDHHPHPKPQPHHTHKNPCTSTAPPDHLLSPSIKTCKYQLKDSQNPARNPPLLPLHHHSRHLSPSANTPPHTHTMAVKEEAQPCPEALPPPAQTPAHR
ncbi:hypothetical protein M0R45_014594 [Rubus argutus]|uniref:Uncharacterized protein n=1 Tax=Rubus argutus TaxID=59490 RepID=A0AAW1XNG3_RUBAR